MQIRFGGANELEYKPNMIHIVLHCNILCIGFICSCSYRSIIARTNCRITTAPNWYYTAFLLKDNETFCGQQNRNGVNVLLIHLTHTG